jgi:hypothetical protein
LRSTPRIFACLGAFAVAVSGLASADEVTAEFAPTFAEGDVIQYHQIEKLRPFLPEPFWEHRRFFF